MAPGTSENAEQSTHRISANVKKYRLQNGLTLLIKENHNTPVAASVVFVKAGYFDEPDRLSGITHVIEHMLFKGTLRRPEEDQFAREIRELGGILNASTYYDRTSYYVVVPAEKLDHAFEIQADAIQNARIDPEALKREIEVIVQESMQKHDNPNAMLFESLYAAAYDQHRIRRWRMGYPDTLRSFTRDDLKQFLKDAYRPENMVVAVVGDVDAAEVRAMAEKQWGRLQRGTVALDAGPEEPENIGFRYKRLSGDTRQRLVCFHFPAPPILHPDVPALTVLGSLLSDGRSSRLFRHLREEMKVVNSSWASYEGFDKLGMFLLGAEVIEADPRKAEKALWGEILRLQQTPVHASELERIKIRIESQRLASQEEVLGMASELASCETMGGFEYADTFLEQLRAVTAEDVQRAAQTWFTLQKATLVEYLPSSDAVPEFSAESLEAELAHGHPASAVPVLPAGALSGATPEHHPFHFSRSAFDAVTRGLTLPWGGHLLYKTRRDLPLVSITILFHGGRRGESITSCGITNLMLKSCLKGTRNWTGEEIAARIEGLGSGIGITVGSDCFGFSMKVKRDLLSDAFAILSDVVAHPTFPSEQVEREKQAVLAELRRQHDSIGSVAMDLYSAACFGENHPYGLPAVGSPGAIEPLLRADLAVWHQRHVTAPNLVVGMVGDVDEREAVDLFSSLLDRRTSTAAERLPLPAHSGPLIREKAAVRDKQQTAAVLGFDGADMYSGDRHILDMAAEILSGMGGRLFRAVRGEHALAYQVAAFHRSRQEAGSFLTYVSTAPENEELARELIIKECERLGREPVTNRELEAARAAIIGQYTIGSQTFSSQSMELAGTGIYGLPLEEPQLYLQRIQDTTAEDIQYAAARYLDPARSCLGVVRGNTLNPIHK